MHNFGYRLLSWSSIFFAPISVNNSKKMLSFLFYLPTAVFPSLFSTHESCLNGNEEQSFRRFNPFYTLRIMHYLGVLNKRIQAARCKLLRERSQKIEKLTKELAEKEVQLSDLQTKLGIATESIQLVLRKVCKLSLLLCQC